MSGSSALRGSCLCGGVAYEIDGAYSDVGQCHCPKCRKVSGSSANAIVLTASGSLRWVRGSEQVARYEMPDGWTSTFCRVCGCPMPMLGADGKLYWVPAGSLDDDPGLAVVQHIYVGQKAGWETIGGDAPQHDGEAPST